MGLRPDRSLELVENPPKIKSDCSSMTLVDRLISNYAENHRRDLYCSSKLDTRNNQVKSTLSHLSAPRRVHYMNTRRRACALLDLPESTSEEIL